MPLLTLAAAAALLTLSGQDAPQVPKTTQTAPTRFRGPTSDVGVWYDRISFELIESGSRAVAIGKPAQILWRDAGMYFVANTIESDIVVDSEGRGYYLDNAKFTGQARLNFDFDTALDFLQEAAGGALEARSEMPAARVDLITERFSYKGDYVAGTAFLPVAFDVHATGHDVQEVKQQTGVKKRESRIAFDMHGVSGELGLLTHAKKGVLPLRTGFLNGPVTFKARRESTLAGQAEPPMEIKGTADRMEYDFVSAEHTVTLIGNIRVDGLGSIYQGSTTGQRAVLTFGADNQVKKVVVEQAVTNVKPQPKPGGGGR